MKKGKGVYEDKLKRFKWRLSKWLRAEESQKVPFEKKWVF
jgi:hypothetical protein